MVIGIVIGLIVGLTVGVLAVFAWHTASVSSLRARVEVAERSARTEAQIIESVRAAQAEAMRDSSEMLAELAGQKMQTSTAKVEGLVNPVATQLKQLQERLGAVEEQRREESGAVKEMVTNLRQVTLQLQGETKNLSSAMKDTRVRGSWGEQQLRRICELAGLMEHCDFSEQVHVAGDAGASRPDLVVRLPEGRTIIVDSKVPLNAYMDAVEATDPAIERQHLEDHAKKVYEHATALAKREYTTKVDGSVDFVVMFVPGEASLAEAYRVRPALFDEAAARGVILATPSTLLALLKAVAFGWRQEQLARNALEIERLGSEMLDRISVFSGHFTGVGKALKQSVDAYNKAVGSMQSRVLPQATKMREHGVRTGRTMGEPQPIDTEPRALGGK